MLRSIPWLLPVLLLAFTGCGPGAPRSELVRWYTTDSAPTAMFQELHAEPGSRVVVVRFNATTHTLYRRAAGSSITSLFMRDFKVTDASGRILDTPLSNYHRPHPLVEPAEGMAALELVLVGPEESLAAGPLTLTYHDMPPLVLTPEKRTQPPEN